MAGLRGGYVDWSRVAKNVISKPGKSFYNAGLRYIGAGGGLKGYREAFTNPFSAQIARASAPTGIYGNNRYYAVPKDDGGWNYFKDNMSVSEADWVRESGLNPPQVSASSFVQSRYNIPKEAITSDAGIGDESGSGGTGSGGTSSTNTFVPVTFLGQTYTDPESLAIAKKNYLDLLNREKLQEIVTGLNRYVGGENASWDTVGGEIGENKTSFLNKIARYLDEYNKGEQKDYGKVRGYYSGLGDMYQSSQEIRNRNIADEYNTARTDLNRQKEEGLTGLRRTFQDYIDSANANKTALSRNYLASMDKLANANEGDIQDTIANGLGGTSVQITNPDVQKANTGTSTSLLNSLQRVKNNVFRINRGDNTEQNILSHLYQGL